MTCFMRYLSDLFDELSIEETPENKRKMQKELRKIIGVESKKCWDIWKGVKPWLVDSKKRGIMIEQLKKSFH